jgi:hypothetical protein
MQKILGGTLSESNDKYIEENTMLLGILTLLTALCISAVAIYYSVAGLVAIFAAAAVPIMIMGGVLEVGKLVTAVWLHKHWKQAAWWLRSYLAFAVFVLMLITSMGIFGFLSKAHIAQTSAGEESVAQIERIDDEIARQISIVGRSENKVRELESSTFSNDTQIQEQIDKEQIRIESAYNRVQPAIDEQNVIIAGVTKLFQTELDKIDNDLTILQSYVNNGEVKKAQQMIGASADGVFGKKTAEKIGDWKDVRQQDRDKWLTRLQESANSPTVQEARKEIARLRSVADDNITQSNTLINRLREKLGTGAPNIDALIDEQFARVKTANTEIETLTDEKFELESEYRQLEAEVGPIKYIAEFVYGETADRNMLEEAVRWVIIIIIFVFDPLAVLLLIASQYTFEWNKNRKPQTSLTDDDFEEYDRMRAELIAANIPPSVKPAVPEEELKFEDIDQETIDNEFKDEGYEERKERYERVMAPHRSKDIQPESTINKEYPDTKNAFFFAEEIEQIKKKEVILKAELDETPEQKQRREHVDLLEADASIAERKRYWKDHNPNENLKSWKTLYIQGRIDKLPWVPDEQGYVQNSEQSDDTIWKRLKK